MAGVEVRCGVATARLLEGRRSFTFTFTLPEAAMLAGARFGLFVGLAVYE